MDNKHIYDEYQAYRWICNEVGEPPLDQNNESWEDHHKSLIHKYLKG